MISFITMPIFSNRVHHFLVIRSYLLTYLLLHICGRFFDLSIDQNHPAISRY